jgi:hypothetical protein
VSRANGASLETTRCPIRVDGKILTSSLGAPKVGEHNAEVRKEFLGDDSFGVPPSGGTDNPGVSKPRKRGTPN